MQDYSRSRHSRFANDFATPEAPHIYAGLRAYDSATWFVVIALLLQTILSTSLALRSNGTYQDDELRHYLVARTMQHDWRMLLNVWGRPGFTILMAAPASIGQIATGFEATRLMTVVLAVLTSVLAYLAARQIKAPLPWLVPWLLLLMPLWMGLSFTPTTEMAAAFYLMAGTWRLAHGQRRWAAVCFALLPLTRHELIVLLVPATGYFLLRRDFWAFLLLGWAEALWNLLAIIAGEKLPLQRFFAPIDQGHLGHGNVLHYFNRWLEMGGTAIVGLTLAGAAMVMAREANHWRRLGASSPAARRARMRLFIAGGAVGVVALQTLLYQFNRFASGGYARFLIPIAPWMAITCLFAIVALLRGRRPVLLLITAAVILAACYSKSWITINTPCYVAATVLVALTIAWRIRLTAAMALAILLCLNALQWRSDVHPYLIQPHQILIKNAIAELQQQFPNERIVGASPWVKYFQNQSMDEDEADARRRWEQDDPPGVLYLYDQSHATAVPLDWFTAFPSRIVMDRWLPSDADDEPYLQVLQRLPN
jgi:hypothetical protein